MSLQTAFGYLVAAGCKDTELAAMPRYLPRSASIRTSLRKMGLNVIAVSLGVPFFYSNSRLDLHSARKSVRDESLAYARKSIDFASQLEADVIYACSMSRGPREERDRALEHLMRAAAECADYARGAALKFALEPFPSGELPTVLETNALIRETRSNNLGILLDTGHATITGEALGAAVKILEGQHRPRPPQQQRWSTGHALGAPEREAAR
jgi:sugar phosphate isomerase/epimerase